MKYENFMTKGVALLLTVAALGGYQLTAARRDRIVRANREEIARAEAQNAEILRLRGESASPWNDGVYTGTGAGFGGDITVSVTVEDGRIAALRVLSAEQEDQAYFSQATAVIDDILAHQAAEADAVSGATFSSMGILAAAEEAIGKAVKDGGN